MILTTIDLLSHQPLKHPLHNSHLDLQCEPTTALISFSSSTAIAAERYLCLSLPVCLVDDFSFVIATYR